MRRILYLAASFATMWSTGCNTSSHHHGPSVNRGEYGCFSDTECATGLICVRDQSSQGGACRIGECNRERSCPEGHRCETDTYRCRPTDDSPCSAIECQSGYRCDPESGECVIIDGQACATHDDCVNGICMTGICRTVECVSDANCELNQVCDESNRCVDVLIECLDPDGDGYGRGVECLGADCDETSTDIHTGVLEDGSTLCEDGIDNNCDGVDSACVVDDMDGDGFTPETGDCDENDPTVNPGRAETPYNHKDDDCDPTTPDGDLDGDGWSSERTYSREERLACRAACKAVSPNAYAECVADPMAIFDPDQSPEDLAQRIEEYCAQRVEREEIRCNQTCRPDCDDMNPNLNPGAEEIPRNGVDENCDGLDRLRSDIDTDMDGFTEQMGDCGEGDPRINPSANEIPYNGRDDDCNLATLDDDLDEDGYGVADDCDDTDPTINPGIKEAYYNGIDDDCDPLTDDRDADGDGFIASEMDGDDCNDRVASVRPRAPEIPYNGIDDDCNRETPDDDIDEDGVPLAEDCDDNNRLISPNAIENARENCSDGIDHDCKAGDVICDEFATDDDGDGVPDDFDCEPLNPTVPGMREILGNSIDDDCNPDTADLLGQCVDDPLEGERGNAIRELAFPIIDGNTRELQYEDLILCPYDEDWYVVQVQEGDGLEVDIFFRHADGNIDVRLYRLASDSSIELVDTSRSESDDETVYLRRDAEGPGRYFVQVFRPKQSDDVFSYDMTVSIFTDCFDDVRGPAGEHNDTRLTASTMPPFGERRQVCDYDDDWYRFTVDRLENSRIDLLFDHTQGDLDIALYDTEGQRLSTSATITNNEAMQIQLSPGEYSVRVYGFLSSQNDYVLLRSDREPIELNAEILEATMIPDYRRGRSGLAVVNLAFDAPENAVIFGLTVSELKLPHPFLNDLRVTLMWNNEPIKVIWDRNGSFGRDGGLDDDFMPFTSEDITFKNRSYAGFAGLPAKGVFGVKIEDLTEGDVGTLDRLRVRLEYATPVEPIQMRE